MLPHHPSTWIRHGDLADAGNDYRMLAAAPTLVTDGIPVPPKLRDELASLDIIGAAAGAYSATIVVWGYKPGSNIYLADGSFPATTNGAGWTNLGTIAVTGTLAGREVHQLQGATAFTRLAVQQTSPVGAPNIWGDFGFSPHDGLSE